MGRGQGQLTDSTVREKGSEEGRGRTRKDTRVRMGGRNEPIRKRRQFPEGG